MTKGNQSLNYSILRRIGVWDSVIFLLKSVKKGGEELLPKQREKSTSR
jgi:hypothetical protein